MAAADKPNNEDVERLLREAQAAAGMHVAAEGSLESAAPGSQGSPLDPARSTQTEDAEFAATAVATAPRPMPGNYSAASSSVGDDISFLLAQAEQAIASVDQPVDPAIQGIAPFQLRDFSGAPASGEKATLELLRDVDLDVRIELGRTQMYLEDVLKLKRGAVVALDKMAGDPVDVFVNGRLIARGEVLVMNDNFCIRVAELVASDELK